MVNDYEVFLASESLGKQLDDIGFFMDPTNALSSESPELAMLQSQYGVSKELILKIPTLSSESIKASAKKALDNVLKFLQNLYAKIVKFLKKTAKKIGDFLSSFRKSGDEKKAKEYDVDLDLVNRVVEDSLFTQLTKRVYLDTFQDKYLGFTEEEKEILSKVYPKDKADDYASVFEDVKDNDILAANMFILFKTNYTALESAIQSLTESIKSKNYDIPESIIGTELLVTEQGFIKKYRLEEGTMTYTTLSTDNDLPDTPTTSIDDAKTYIEQPSLSDLAKAIDGIDESEITDDNVRKFKTLFDILNIFQKQAMSITAILVRNSVYLNKAMTAMKHVEFITELRKKGNE